jgi:uncharacterized protein YdeI (YjbR/CyaY-like superfamily)
MPGDRPVAPRDATYFADAAAWRRWLEAHHAAAEELWVGFRKKGSGLPSLTWPESVDVALCFGWIDGVRQSVDATSYRIRFTPRRAGSTWSDVNVGRMRALAEAGLVAPAGRAAFEARTDARTGVYAYEQRADAALAPDDEARFRANAAAWAYFASCPPSYRRTAIWWVVSAMRAETRRRRLDTLVADSAAGRRIASQRRATDG